MGSPLKIKEDRTPAELRRLARRERDGHFDLMDRCPKLAEELTKDLADARPARPRPGHPLTAAIAALEKVANFYEGIYRLAKHPQGALVVERQRGVNAGENVHRRAGVKMHH